MKHRLVLLSASIIMTWYAGTWRSRLKIAGVGWASAVVLALVTGSYRTMT